MKGNQKVIDSFNHLLANELAAIDQYFIHSRMYDDWGLNELYERLEHEREEETEHADFLIKRMLFLEGKPNLVKRRDLLIGNDVKEMMENDLVLEMEVVVALREVISVCEQEHDYQSREILEKLLFDTEEDHVYWLEQQIGLIGKIGIENYIQSKMGASNPAT
ncbi:bacterioferritin [Psychromonas sp. Urea-02u-13]|uniref:bacterioferritin n=1 Tax=Psychromonas sp. Urea-02u-13 TaxID=2058326 RepID=UPI000C3434F8|nr:bacterioferritin [Psychromonas sp. Urea-02u-13]PKG38297.1 bacterioferritin [Psychromonas sp. Urea-02u-13]